MSIFRYRHCAFAFFVTTLAVVAAAAQTAESKAASFRWTDKLPAENVIAH